MKRFTTIIALIICLSFIFCAGCGEQTDTPDNNGKPVIAVSIPPEASFVSAVAGDTVNVVTMIPAGNSPSNYEPTPMLKEQFAKAAIYFPIGVPTEQNNILPYVSDNTGVVFLNDAAAEKYEELLLDGERDPHIWLSPKRVETMISAIEEELSALMPENSQFYAANAAAYIEQLQELDQKLTSALADFSNRKFIVFHPAFGYLAADYGLEMYALEEEGKEATAAHMQEMIDLAKKENIKVIFYQAEIDSHQSEAFAEELGGKTVMLDPLSENYIENMKLMVETIIEVME